MRCLTLRCLTFILIFFSNFSYAANALVLPSPGNNSGLFSVFTTVLGFLEHYDRAKCSGIEIDFAEEGLYFDAQKGKNWWSYYFEPVKLGAQENKKLVSHSLKRQFTKRGYNGMGRTQAYEIIQKYVRLQPALQKKIDAFAAQHFSGENIIGVHYRGTDKISEAPKVPYKQVVEKVRAVISSSPRECKIFIATDEQAFLNEMIAQFPNRVCYTDAHRSSDHQPVHRLYKNCYEVGEEAVIDCLLLSKSDILVRTASNLSTCAGYFNPSLPIIDLNCLHVERWKGE